MAILEGRPLGSSPLFAYGLDDQQALVAAALRVPPRPMLCTALGAAGGDRLLEAWLAEDPEPVGINALAATARQVAVSWERRTGGHAQRHMSLALHSLRAVTGPSRPGPGRLVPARPEHRGLVIAWWRAFAIEAGVVADAAADVDHRLPRGRLWLWETPAGQPTSLVAVNPPVAGVVRIGPVYTPPEHRCRGYASAAVAQVSRQALGSGARSCLLFTDLGNPTSNRIYADVGYRRFADWEEYTLTGPGG
jgi:GNAT superfamily N-acetyltransferase